MTEQAIVQWIGAYGYVGIFFLLIFGILGLPIPDEWLLVISGYLVFNRVLSFFPTVAVAAIGSAGGLTVSYVLGRTSSPYLIRRYGHWLSIDDEKVLRTQRWFQGLGCGVLIVGPFIPGVRNLMGYIAGASRLRIHVFVRFAYLGALMSSTSFVMIGYFAGAHINWSYWRYGVIAMATAVLLVASGIPLRAGFWIRRKLQRRPSARMAVGAVCDRPQRRS